MTTLAGLDAFNDLCTKEGLAYSRTGKRYAGTPNSNRIRHRGHISVVDLLRRGNVSLSAQIARDQRCGGDSTGAECNGGRKQNYQEQERARQRDYREKQQAYTAAAREFSRDLVFVSAPLGIAANLIGAYLPLYAIGTGLIFGGIFSVGAGYLGYWSYLDDWVRFVSLLAGFVILLFVGYHRIAGSNTRVGSP
jgi:hypothetical protein